MKKLVVVVGVAALAILAVVDAPLLPSAPPAAAPSPTPFPPAGVPAAASVETAPATPSPTSAVTIEPAAGDPMVERNSTTFVESFDGAPSSPQPWNPSHWDVAVHSRDVDTWRLLEPVGAHHGRDCAPFPQVHEITAYEDAAFLCRDHLMTALNASGYGVIYLTPDHLVDFSDGEAVIRFDVSTLRTSQRDWIDLWITPFEDHHQAPLEGFLPDLAGPPTRAVQVRMDDANGGGSMFEVNVYREHEGSTVDGNWWLAYESFLTPDAARRDTFELRLSRDHVRFGMPDYDQWWVDAAMPPLDWNLGVVQLGHHSYNPAKDEAGTPNTWHWDNVEIAPARPFTMIKADRRYIGPSTTATVRFGRPSPAGAHLRFSGMAEGFDVSFDGGTTWSAAQRPAQRTRNGLLYSNYWTPIPAGARQVELRADKGWLPSWIAKDFAVWSLEEPAATPARLQSAEARS